MTLKFSGFRAVVKEHVFCKISSSWVQRFTSYRANREKKTPTKKIQSVATARTVILMSQKWSFGGWRPLWAVARRQWLLYSYFTAMIALFAAVCCRIGVTISWRGMKASTAVCRQSSFPLLNYGLRTFCSTTGRLFTYAAVRHAICRYVRFLPVCPSVCPVRVYNSKTKGRRKTKNGAIVPWAGVNSVPILSAKGLRPRLKVCMVE